jgi:hypothetical protein
LKPLAWMLEKIETELITAAPAKGSTFTSEPS